MGKSAGDGGNAERIFGRGLGTDGESAVDRRGLERRREAASARDVGIENAPFGLVHHNA